MIVVTTDELEIGKHTYIKGKTLELSDFAASALMGRKVRKADQEERQAFLKERAEKAEAAEEESAKPKAKAGAKKSGSSKKKGSKGEAKKAKSDPSPEDLEDPDFIKGVIRRDDWQEMRPVLATVSAESIPNTWGKSEVSNALVDYMQKLEA